MSPGPHRARRAVRLGVAEREPARPTQTLSLQVLYSLLNQSENMSGWPRVVSEDLVKQVHRLKNEMFVMGGKIRGKTLLPIPEHLESLDGTLESLERWARRDGPAARETRGRDGARSPGGGHRAGQTGHGSPPHHVPGPVQRHVVTCVPQPGEGTPALGCGYPGH